MTDQAALRQRYEALAGDVGSPPETVGELLDRFMKWARDTYVQRKGSSEVTNFRDALKPVRLLYSELSPADFGPGQLRACRAWMQEQHLAASTINARVNKIRRVWKWAVGRTIVDPVASHALQTVEPLRASKPDVQPVPMGLVEKTQRHLSPPIADLVSLQLLTGCRPGEAVICRGCDIDLNGKAWTWRPFTHKNAWRGKDRMIYLGPKAQDLVRPWLRPGFLFQSRLGKPYTVNGYYLMIRKACQKSGLPEWSPNQLRHTAATELDRQFGRETTAAVLGHSRVETTAIYAGRNEAAAIEAVLAVG